MKIYHVETQEDYDDLMIKLENEGCMWVGRDKPTDLNFWYEFEAETVIYLGSWRKGEMTRGDLSEAKRKYSTIPIIKHKAKGGLKMEKVVVPKFVADYFEFHYGGKTPGNWDKADVIRDWDNYINIYGDSILEKWIKNETNFLTFITAIITNDYEVEEEKKYYWRKKKEYTFDFEPFIYINVSKYGRVFFSDEVIADDFYRTEFTETEIRERVSEEDFNKLERVEIDDV